MEFREPAAGLSTCLACGGGIERSLAVAGSPRCHDCRDWQAPLRADLVEASALLLPFAPRRAESDLAKAA